MAACILSLSTIPPGLEWREQATVDTDLMPTNLLCAYRPITPVCHPRLSPPFVTPVCHPRLSPPFVTPVCHPLCLPSPLTPCAVLAATRTVPSRSSRLRTPAGVQPTTACDTVCSARLCLCCLSHVRLPVSPPPGLPQSCLRGCQWQHSCKGRGTSGGCPLARSSRGREG